MAARTAFRPFILSVTTRASLLALASSLPLAALAQDTAPTQRVEVTGSAIKRIDGESALPVQVITREEINKAGLTTASEILSRISASANNLTDGVSIGTGGFRDQMGFNGANLRGCECHDLLCSKLLNLRCRDALHLTRQHRSNLRC